jgi:hypothetical protein
MCRALWGRRDPAPGGRADALRDGPSCAIQRDNGPNAIRKLVLVQTLVVPSAPRGARQSIFATRRSSSIPAAVLVAVRQGNPEHSGAQQTDEMRVVLKGARSCSGFRAASHAGRRRFDPGRPLFFPSADHVLASGTIAASRRALRWCRLCGERDAPRRSTCASATSAGCHRSQLAKTCRASYSPEKAWNEGPRILGSGKDFPGVPCLRPAGLCRPLTSYGWMTRSTVAIGMNRVSGLVGVASKPKRA